tara:strand:- start:1737 stop:2390 length:654 start_codon:yes stop_codon:yes gene_type:complete
LDKKILDQQSQHWEINFSNKPEMFGLEPSISAQKSLKIFKDQNISKIIELGAGLGRDTIYFAKNSIHVEALDYSVSGIKRIKQKVKDNSLSELISTRVFDIRNAIPFRDNSIEVFYSHMLYCMALTNDELNKLNNEIHRVLKPGGINIYTVRQIKDGDYQRGVHRGEDLYENDGFIVHFFSKNKVKSLLSGFKNILIEEFEEGSFPRRLYFVVNKKL